MLGGFMIKRIIFDIDGTLITGVDFSSYVANTLKKYGMEDIEKTKQFLLNIKEYEKTYNSYDRNLYLKFFSDKLGCELDNHFLEIFFQELRKAIPENAEKIKSMLAEMNEYELVLLSNYFEESQRNRLTAGLYILSSRTNLIFSTSTLVFKELVFSIFTLTTTYLLFFKILLPP